MNLKRLYDDQKRIVGVKILDTGLDAEQNWDQGQIMQFAAEGWMRMVGDTIELTSDKDTLVYDILRKPGYYVASTGERIPVSELAMYEFMNQAVAVLAPKEARSFLASKGLPANDYTASRIYNCRLRPEQHERYRAVRNAAGNRVAAHTQR